MSVGVFQQPDHETQTGTVYKTAIDNSIAVLARLAAAFAPRELSNPIMKVRVDPGAIFVGGVLTEVGLQYTGTISAPTTNPRIDRVVLDPTTGAVSVVTGTPASSPVAPAIPAGKMPICQVLLQTSSTTIINSMITDERVCLPPLPTGALVQQVHTASGTIGSTTNAIPDDDTIPQSNEGAEVFTLSITPTNAINYLLVEVVLYVAGYGAGWHINGALFRDSGANAVAVAVGGIGNNNQMSTLCVTYRVAAGSTNPTTFKVRYGPGGASTAYINAASTGRYFGGVLKSSMTISEIKA